MNHSIYLSFTGNAEAALTFYHSIFGGDLTIQKYGEQDNIEEYPFNPDPNWVAHGQLTGTVNIAGGDGGDTPLESQAYSMLLTSNDIDEGRDILTKIASDGGEIIMPYEQAPWGDYYGQARDKFGMVWAFAASPKSQ